MVIVMVIVIVIVIVIVSVMVIACYGHCVFIVVELTGVPGLRHWLTLARHGRNKTLFT